MLSYFFGDLFLKGNHYEIEVYTFFSLVTSKSSERSLKNQGYDVGSLTDALDCISKEGRALGCLN